MYANVGALIKQRAIWNIRIKSWIIAAIITLPFIETLIVRILFYFYPSSDLHSSVYYYQMSYSISFLIRNFLASIIPADIQDIILYPLENIAFILFMRSKPYNYDLYNIVSGVIQFLKVIAVFFVARTWLKKSYIKMHAFGEIVENVSQIKNDLVNRKRV